MTSEIIQSEGPGKPPEEFLDESMTENEEKYEIIEVHNLLNIHLTVYSKMGSSIVIGRNYSRESLQAAVQPHVVRREKFPLSATTFKTYIGPFL